MRDSRSRATKRMVAVLAVIAILAGCPGMVAAQATPIPGPPGTLDAIDEYVLYDPVLRPYRQAVIDQTAGAISHYAIDATVELATGTTPSRITGSVALAFVNGGDEPVEAVYFRLYANDPRYAEGAMLMREVTVGGRPVEPVLSQADTVAEVALPAPLGPGERIDIDYLFRTAVPTAPEQSYGLFSYQPEGGTLVLAHWLPLLAGRGADSDWNLEAPSTFGDVIFSNIALFEANITAPDDLVLVSTGTAVVEASEDGTSRHRIVTGPVRDLTMVLDDDYEVATIEVDGTLVQSFYNPEHARGGELVLDYGARSLALYNDLFGPYPYEEMDLVDLTVRNGAAGVEFPQLMFIGGSYYDQERDAPDDPPTFLETIVVHEVAHQWFFGLVGNDQYQDAFIDEGLANYMSTEVYYAAAYDTEVAAAERARQLERPYLDRLFGPGDVIVDQPTDAFASDGAYVVAVYGKAALGFHAIREEIGEEAFIAGLARYTAAYRFDVATPADLLAAFEAASDQRLDELWRHWFEAAEGTDDYGPEDLEAIRNA
ncbi:MAG: M1 family metallopeptidase [Chloroflexia bacterium]|nr:M1 family metallopeptidase [Chloroflexia bacterium]